MKKPRLSPRKAPRQERSAQLVEDILHGAIRVLKKEGGRKFTTIRVAEEAGISVGSLYQYFPNKESILFQVQHREWLATSQMVLRMLGESRYSPEARLRRTVRAFFETEWEEASLRRALVETGVMMEETKAYRELMEAVLTRMAEFVGEMAPGMKVGKRRFAAEFVFRTIAALGEEVTTTAETVEEVRKWAGECAEMAVGYLMGLVAAGARQRGYRR